MPKEVVEAAPALKEVVQVIPQIQKAAAIAPVIVDLVQKDGRQKM
jgi:hypothetical protein